MHALPRSLMSIALAATFAIASSHRAEAAPPTFTQEFNIETVPCQGLAVDGARYAYVAGASSSFCEAGTAGPTTNNIMPPALLFGAGGVLQIRFDKPTTVFGFGVAQLSDRALPQSVIVDLFSPGKGTLRKQLLLDNFPDPDFAGGRFEYRGPAISGAAIRIANETSGRPVAIDDVTYTRAPGRVR